MINQKLIEEVCVKLLGRAATNLPADVENALKKAFEEETSDIAKTQLRAILDNMKLAEETCKPMCQDTGVPIFYVEVGTEARVEGNIEEGIKNAVLRATEEIPLRPNVVHPLTRENPGTNVGQKMPYINYSLSPGRDYIEITAFPKGVGSENMSALGMLKPVEGIRGVKRFVLDTVIAAGSQPCPPIIVGVGVGGSADIAMKLAKEALLRPLDQKHPEEPIANLEKELLEAINSTGIGPMGLGGKTTSLGVNVEYAYTHTGGLPVGVNIQCWAARKATAKIHSDGRVEWISHPR